MTWYISVKHNGEELSGRLLDALMADPEIAQTEKVRIDMMKRFGYFSTESNGHLCGIRAVVPQAHRRNQGLDRPGRLDKRRNRRIPARVHRGPQLVRDRFPELDEGAADEVRARGALPGARQLHHRVAGDRPPVPWPLQRRQPRLHNQPARRLHSRGARATSTPTASTYRA